MRYTEREVQSLTFSCKIMLRVQSKKWRQKEIVCCYWVDYAVTVAQLCDTEKKRKEKRKKKNQWQSDKKIHWNSLFQQ